MSYGLVPGPEIEMIGIREHYLTPDLHDMILMDSLNAGLSSNRHKNRGLYISMRSCQSSCTCKTIGRMYCKFKGHYIKLRVKN